MSEYYFTGSPDYLEHHGILGMNWGVRRFQNPDGTLTTAGRKRYSQVETKNHPQHEGYFSPNLTTRKADFSGGGSSDDHNVSGARAVYRDGKYFVEVQTADGQRFPLEVPPKLLALGKDEAVKQIMEEMKENDVDVSESTISSIVNQMLTKEIPDRQSDFIENNSQRERRDAAFKKYFGHSDEYYDLEDDDYLEHHGILGMKWGVRRFQNPDGSLTPEGRARYGDVLTKKQMNNYIREYNLRTGSNKTINKNTVFKTPNGMYDYKGRKLRNTDVEVENPTEEKKTASESKPSDKKRMTDDELRAANERMRLEEEYLKHIANLNPKKVSLGQQFTNNLKNELMTSIPRGISGMIENAIKSAGNSKPQESKEKEAPKKTSTNLDLSTASDQQVKDAITRLRNENTFKELKDKRAESISQDEHYEKLAQEMFNSHAFENVDDIKVPDGQELWDSSNWGTDYSGKKYKFK